MPRHGSVAPTERKHVRKVPNAPPGFVTFRHERVVRVPPLRPETKKA